MKKIIISLMCLLLIMLTGCTTFSLEDLGFYSTDTKEKPKTKTKFTTTYKTVSDIDEYLKEKYGIEIKDNSSVENFTQNVTGSIYENTTENTTQESVQEESNKENSSVNSVDQEKKKLENEVKKAQEIEEESNKENNSVNSVDQEKKKLENEVKKAQEIEEENKRYKDEIDRIRTAYEGEIKANQFEINSCNSMMTSYYSESALKSLYSQVEQKERKLSLLQMGNGSVVEIQRLQNEIVSLRQQIAEMERNKILDSEIQKCKAQIASLEKAMERKISDENLKHQNNLINIENKYR